MPTTTSILWTALPNGGPSGAYKCSVFVSPRLEGGGPTGLLSDYDLGNWTATVQALLASESSFQVELGPGGPLLATTVAPAYVAELDPALWDAIFPPSNTKVAERVFQDHSKRWVRSFRVGVVEDYIQGLYDEVATSHVDGFPDLKAPTGPVIDLLTLMGRALEPISVALPPPREVDDLGRPLPKQYEPVPLRGPAIHPDQATENQLTTLAGTLGLGGIPISEIFRAYRFYQRGNHLPYRSKDVPYDPDAVPDPPKEPEFDFHQAMAGLGDHPNVLRKLGLIVDLIVPYAEADLSLYGQLQLVPPALGPIASITPWTKYEVQGAKGFRPTPMPQGDLRDGMLRLDSKSPHRVLQTDPDGNAIKVFDYAANMHRHRTRLLSERLKRPEAKSSQAPEETSLPALRSGGFQVVRDQRDAKSWYHLSRQATIEGDLESSVLYADDVLRGFRVDVDYRGRWYSLCRRHGDIQLAGSILPQPGPNEGYHKAESATSDAEDVPQGQQQPDLYLHETMFAWRNWSLVAPVPGKTIVPKRQPDKRQTESVEHSENVPGAGFDIAANYKPEPLSLAPLRFGEAYRFRARAVDLAGNSLAPPPSPSFPDPEPDQVRSDVWASPPITYLRYDPVPAPMALLTDKVTWGESMEQVVIRTRADGDVAEPLPVEVGYLESEIFIPENTRWIAPPKTDVGTAEAHGTFDSLFQTPGVAFNVLSRESGSFDDLGVTGTEVVDVDGNVVDTTVVDGFWDQFKKGDPLPDGMYFVHTQDPLELPYLPDPLAHGATLWPLDGSGSWAHRAYASSGYPDAEPFRLTLAEGTAIEVDLTSGTVRVPPGEMVAVRYASAVVPPDSPDEGELALMGRWHSMGQAGRDTTKTHFWQHWMLTPFRTFVFVHAVERPLTEPQAIALQFDKQRGETFVTLVEGAGKTHSPSTGEVELRGRWVDWVDDPTATEDKDDPHPESKDSHVWDRRIDYGEDPFYVPTPDQPHGPKHEFGDTKHRWVYYRFIGTTRYREYFPPSLVDYEIVEPHPHDPELTQKKKLTTRPGPEYLQDGEPVNIPSSARPIPPDVLYVLPTFKWLDTASGRRRLGRGLRIYLKRGWFSSGVDERLGVVLFPSGPVLSTVADRLRKYVSQWGSDPIFDRDLGVGLQPSQFTYDPAFPDTAPRELGESLMVAETESTGQPLFVQVLGFEPLFDTERKLWYVDLELLPTDHYYTFIRFGLCRFQPYSLPNCEISRVVRTEFAQLLADRSATLTSRDGSIDVTLAGPSALSQLGEQLPVRATPGAAVTPGDGIGSTQLAAIVPPPGPTPPPDVVLPPILSPDPAAGRAHKVIARVESRPLGFGDDPHIGWEALDATELPAHTAFGMPGIVFWKGSVTWPIDGLPEGHEFRLSISEYETYQTDDDVADERTSTSASGKWVKDRLVYVDTFPLTLEPGGLTGS